MIEFSGIEFRHVDNRLMSLKLVQLGLSQAAMFDAKGEVLQPTRGAAPQARPGPARDVSARDQREHRHVALRARGVCPGARSDRRRDRRADGDHDAQSAHRGRRRRPARLSGARRRARRGGQDGADLRLLRVLPAGQLLAPLHDSSPSPWFSAAGAARLSVFDEKYYAGSRGRHPRGLRPPVRPGPASSTSTPCWIRHTGSSVRPPTMHRAGRSRQALRLPSRSRLAGSARRLRPQRASHRFRARSFALIKAATPVGGHGPEEVAELIKRRGFFGSARSAANLEFAPRSVLTASAGVVSLN